ncbi:hypothetical protein KSC_033490 [Ktedonobacter sp. SOSP1-52]|nr:hypothetical protein KSC_033490 [Ktedonobacter sp. SOSP1-52]
MDGWKHRYEVYQRDHHWREQQQNCLAERRAAEQAMRSLLRHFLDEELSLQAFNNRFQHQIHEAWSLFGPRGVEGLVLHTLVKHALQQERLATLFRAILPVGKATPDED